MKSHYRLTFLFVGLFFCIAVVAPAQNARDFYKTGEEFFENKNYTDAIEHFTKALNIEPDYEDAYLMRAKAYEKTGEMEDALSDYERLTVLDPRAEEPFYHAARLLNQLERYEEAIEYADKAIEKGRKYIEAYHEKIKAYDAMGKYEIALVTAEAALAEKREAINYYYYGYISMKLNKNVEAELALEDAIRKDDEYQPTFITMAYVKLNLDKKEEALHIANRAVALSDENVDAYFARAEVYRQKLEFPKAIDDLSRITMLDANNEEAYFTRALCYQDFNQHLNAITDFTKVLTLNPENFDALFKRAASYEQIQDYEKAIADYDKIIEITEYNPEAKQLIAEANERLFELNREEKAPAITIVEPVIRAEGQLHIPANAATIALKVKVDDQSEIKLLQVEERDFTAMLNEDDLYEVQLVVKDKESLTITATDVYDNTANAEYTIVRTEINPPAVQLVSPYASDNNVIMLASNDPILYVEGEITDESLIKNIFVNDATASYLSDEENPGFSATIDITNKNKITVRATDLYGNQTVEEYTLDRSSANLLDSNPMGKTWVVFIENSDYTSFASLDGPTKDVSVMKQALANYQIHNIIHKKNMSKTDMERFFSIELRDMVRSNHVNSLMVWYAGHGKFINETGYWIPTTAKRDDEFTYFNINSLRASMQSYSQYITHTLVVTDACESGPSFYQAMRSELTERSCNDVTATKFKSSQVLSSAGYELASDQSQFTKTFASSLTYNSNDCIPIESIVIKVTEAVRNNAANQTPKFGKINGLEDENGTFFFIRK